MIPIPEVQLKFYRLQQTENTLLLTHQACIGTYSDHTMLKGPLGDSFWFASLRLQNTEMQQGGHQIRCAFASVCITGSSQMEHKTKIVH